jgi:uncharacterized protein with beta-barrel porin domain
MPLTLFARFAWVHDWTSPPGLNAAFQTLPGASFTVNGAAPATDSALASAGAELQIAPNWTLVGKFEAELASRSQTYSGIGTLRATW